MWILHHSYGDRRSILKIEWDLIMPSSNHHIWWSKSYMINRFEYNLTNPVQYVSVAWTTHYHMHTIKEKKGVLSIVITTSFLKGKFMNASKFKLTLEFKTMWVSFQCLMIIIKKACFCIFMMYNVRISWIFCINNYFANLWFVFNMWKSTKSQISLYPTPRSVYCVHDLI